MNRSKIIIFLLICSVNCAFAQNTERKLIGHVSIDGSYGKTQENSIPFCKITIISSADSCKKAFAITDLHGDYITHGPIITGECHLYFEIDGWEHYSAKDTSFFDDKIEAKLKTWNHSLKPSKKTEKRTYKAVSITINNSHKTTYTNAINLLSLYNQISITDDKITDNNGEVYVFVNGHCSTPQKIRRIKAQKVLEIEYYDISEPISVAKNPYTGAVNIITKRN